MVEIFGRKHQKLQEELEESGLEILTIVDRLEWLIDCLNIQLSNGTSSELMNLSSATVSIIMKPSLHYQNLPKFPLEPSTVFHLQLLFIHFRTSFRPYLTEVSLATDSDRVKLDFDVYNFSQ
jgi:hypothetical protein